MRGGLPIVPRALLFSSSQSPKDTKRPLLWRREPLLISPFCLFIKLLVVSLSQAYFADGDKVSAT